jgi:NTP pyrophosphatase (non-canonical NTP hydrolase)
MSQTIKEWMKRCYDVAQEKGWHNKPLHIENELMNFHAEISEAWEEIRKGYSLTDFYYADINEEGDIIPFGVNDESYIVNGLKPEGFPIEIADLLIRIFHTCAYHEIDIEKYMELKEAYNKTRSYRHGGKTC